MILSCRAHFLAAAPGVLHWGSNHGKWFKASSRPIRTHPSEPDFASSHIHLWPLAGEFPASWLAYLRASYESTECQKRVRTGIVGIPTALSSHILLMSRHRLLNFIPACPGHDHLWPELLYLLPDYFFRICFFKQLGYIIYTPSSSPVLKTFKYS